MAVEMVFLPGAERIDATLDEKLMKLVELIEARERRLLATDQCRLRVVGGRDLPVQVRTNVTP